MNIRQRRPFKILSWLPLFGGLLLLSPQQISIADDNPLITGAVNVGSKIDNAAQTKAIDTVKSAAGDAVTNFAADRVLGAAPQAPVATGPAVDLTSAPSTQPQQATSPYQTASQLQNNVTIAQTQAQQAQSTLFQAQSALDNCGYFCSTADKVNLQSQRDQAQAAVSQATVNFNTQNNELIKFSNGQVAQTSQGVTSYVSSTAAPGLTPQQTNQQALNSLSVGNVTAVPGTHTTGNSVAGANCFGLTGADLDACQGTIALKKVALDTNSVGNESTTQNSVRAAAANEQSIQGATNTAVGIAAAPIPVVGSQVSSAAATAINRYVDNQAGPGVSTGAQQLDRADNLSAALSNNQVLAHDAGLTSDQIAQAGATLAKAKAVQDVASAQGTSIYNVNGPADTDALAAATKNELLATGTEMGVALKKTGNTMGSFAASTPANNSDTTATQVGGSASQASTNPTFPTENSTTLRTMERAPSSDGAVAAPTTVSVGAASTPVELAQSYQAPGGTVYNYDPLKQAYISQDGSTQLGTETALKNVGNGNWTPSTATAPSSPGNSGVGGSVAGGGTSSAATPVSYQDDQKAARADQAMQQAQAAAAKDRQTTGPIGDAPAAGTAADGTNYAGPNGLAPLTPATAVGAAVNPGSNPIVPAALTSAPQPAVAGAPAAASPVTPSDGNPSPPGAPGSASSTTSPNPNSGALPVAAAPDPNLKIVTMSDGQRVLINDDKFAPAVSYNTQTFTDTAGNSHTGIVESSAKFVPGVTPDQDKLLANSGYQADSSRTNVTRVPDTSGTYINSDGQLIKDGMNTGKSVPNADGQLTGAQISDSGMIIKDGMYTGKDLQSNGTISSSGGGTNSTNSASGSPELSQLNDLKSARDDWMQNGKTDLNGNPIVSSDLASLLNKEGGTLNPDGSITLPNSNGKGIPLEEAIANEQSAIKNGGGNGSASPATPSAPAQASAPGNPASPPQTGSTTVTTVTKNPDGSTTTTTTTGDAGEKKDPNYSEADHQSSGPCKVSGSLAEMASCTATANLIKGATAVNQLGQMAGQTATQAAGASAQLDAMKQGTQAASLEAAAKTAKIGAEASLATGGVNLFMAAAEAWRAADHKSDSGKLQGVKKEDSPMGLELSEAYDLTSKCGGGSDAKAKACRDRAVASLARRGSAEQSDMSAQAGMAALMAGSQAAQQLASGAIGLKTAEDMEKAARALQDAPSGPGLPVFDNSNFNSDPLAPRANAVVTGNGINPAADAAAANADAAKPDLGLGAPFNPDKNNNDLSGGPTPGAFSAAPAGGGSPGTGAGGGLSGGATAADNTPQQQDSPALADKSSPGYGAGGAYVGGGGSGSGSASNGPDLSGLLAAFMKDKEKDDPAKNGILDYGGRGLASQPESLLGKNVNIFTRVSETYADKTKKGAIR